MSTAIALEPVPALRVELVELRSIFTESPSGSDHEYSRKHVEAIDTILAALSAPRVKDGFACELSSVGNPDFGQYHGKGEGSPTLFIEAADIATLVKIYLAYVRVYDLGGGNMSRECGRIYHRNVFVAEISYNGRVWNHHKFGDPRRREIDPATGKEIQP